MSDDEDLIENYIEDDISEAEETENKRGPNKKDLNKKTEDYEDEPDPDDAVEVKVNENQKIEELDLDNLDISEKSPDVINYIVVPDSERRTLGIMHYPEFTKLVAERATELNNPDVKPYVDVKGLSSNVEIACEEIRQGKCPLMIRRILPGNQVEKYRVNELIIPEHFYSVVRTFSLVN